MDDIKPKVRDLKNTQSEIKAFHAEEIDKTPVEEEAVEAIETHDELFQDIAQYLDNLDRTHEKAKKFFDDVKDIKDWAPVIEKRLTDSDTKSKEPEELKKELKELDVSLDFHLFLLSLF